MCSMDLISRPLPFPPHCSIEGLIFPRPFHPLDTTPASNSALPPSPLAPEHLALHHHSPNIITATTPSPAEKAQPNPQSQQLHFYTPEMAPAPVPITAPDRSLPTNLTTNYPIRPEDRIITEQQLHTSSIPALSGQQILQSDSAHTRPLLLHNSCIPFFKLTEPSPHRPDPGCCISDQR